MANKIEKRNITQANSLINSTCNLKINEKKFMLCVLSKLNPIKESVEVERYTTIKMQCLEILELLGMGKKNYSYLVATSKSLVSKLFPIQEQNGRSVMVCWLSYAEVVEQGFLTVDIHKGIVPYLLNLKEQFTTYKLENVLKFKSSHSIKIYELLKQYEKLKQRKFTIEDLKQVLGIEGKYKKFFEFKKFVLDKTVEEINNYSDLKIDYELRKQGKLYKYVTFNIGSKLYVIKPIKQHKEQTENKQIQGEIKAIMSLIKEDISYEDAKVLYNKANGDIGKIADKYYMGKGKDIENLVGYLIKAIEDDYAAIGVSSNVNPYANKFHNFESRTSKYSADELEKIVLENQKKKFENRGK